MKYIAHITIAQLVPDFNSLSVILNTGTGIRNLKVSERTGFSNTGTRRVNKNQSGNSN